MADDEVKIEPKPHYCVACERDEHPGPYVQTWCECKCHEKGYTNVRYG